MKKLSEIGRTMWAEQKDYDEKLVVSFLDEKIDDTDITFHIYSDAERRELVTEAIKRWEAYKWHKLGGAKELEEFLKEQGL